MSSSSTVVAAVMGMIGVVLMVALIWCVVCIVANWKIYTKAGEPGWKCLIPIYNQYILFKVTWDVKFFWVWVGIYVVNMIVAFLEVPFVGVILGIAMVVVSVAQLHKMSKAFGHDVGFTLGLVFLNPIFMLILAFGSSEYIGPQ